MLWSNFLHFYQPPTQKRYWVDRITDEAYRRLVRGWLDNPHIRLTLNVNACLYEMWAKWGHSDVIEGLRTLLERGQIEFTGSAKYHPLLPKIPDEEIKRQVLLNHQTCVRFLGPKFEAKGFFPPEMAYTRRIAKIAAQMGFEWVIAEELSYRHEPGAVSYRTLYEVSGISSQNDARRLLIFFRERDLSFKILSGQVGTQGLLKQELEKRSGQKYLLTAMDGETFGHHRPGMEKGLLELYQTPGIEPVTVSQLIGKIKPRETVETLPATWALMEKDLNKNIPFARWDDPENEIQAKQWELTSLAIAAVENSRYRINGSGGSGGLDAGFKVSGENLSKEQSQWIKARELLDRALHSDQYWWASARPWWSLEMIERGANELLEVVQTVPDASVEDKSRAQELYYLIITTGFDWQREGKVDEISRQEDEEVRMRTDAGLPNIPNKELDKMITRIRQEMLSVAENYEYERAAQLRDRIEELESYKH